jgi:hypothetical protein
MEGYLSLFLNFKIVRNYTFKIKKCVFKRFFILFIVICADHNTVFFVTLDKILNFGFYFLKIVIINAILIFIIPNDFIFYCLKCHCV